MHDFASFPSANFHKSSTETLTILQLSMCVYVCVCAESCIPLPADKSVHNAQVAVSGMQTSSLWVSGFVSLVTSAKTSPPPDSGDRWTSASVESTDRRR